MSQSQLLKDRRFFPLFWTQFFGAFNDNFLKNAMIILITFKAATVGGIAPAQMVSVAGAIFILPFFLFSATAGQLADKYEKSRLIQIIKLAEVAIMLLAAVGFLTEHFTFLLAVLFLMGLHSTFFGPLKFSILPQCLNEQELVGGNALIEAGTFLSILLGTIAGGVLVAIPSWGPLLVSAILVGTAIIGYLASLQIRNAAPVDPELYVQWNPITPTWTILKDTRKNNTVFRSILGISWFWFFGGAMLSLFPPYCKEILKSSESVITLFLACFSVGIGIGALLCEKMSQRRIELGLVPLGSIGMSMFCIDLYFSGHPEVILSRLNENFGAWDLVQTFQGLHLVTDLVLLAIFSGFFIVPLNALIQERSEPSHRSRVIAGNNILNAFFMVVTSVMLIGLMKQGLTIPQIFLVLAGLNGLVAIYIYTLVPEFLIRFAMWVLANLVYRLEVIGEENIPTKGGAVLVCNHVSFIDWLVLGAAIFRPIRFVMYYKFGQGLLGRQIIKHTKAIPIASAKEDPKILANAFEQIAKELSKGHLVCIFPEGQITRDGELNLFRGGVEKIIATTPVPVIPMALNGLWGSFFSRKNGRAMSGVPKRFKLRVSLVIGKPIRPDKVSAAFLQEKVTEMVVTQ